MSDSPTLYYSGFPITAMKLATMKLTLSSRSCPWRGSGFGLGIHFRVLLIASQLSISCFSNFCEEHTRSSSYLWVASLDRFAAKYKFWTTWVHFGLCPCASKLCLPSVYPWHHTCDKMYQAFCVLHATKNGAGLGMRQGLLDETFSSLCLHSMYCMKMCSMYSFISSSLDQ